MGNRNCKKIELFPDERVLYSTGRSFLRFFVWLPVGGLGVSLGLSCFFLYDTISSFRSVSAVHVPVLIFLLCMTFALCCVFWFVVRMICRNLKDKVVITDKRVHWLVGGEKGHIERLKVRGYRFYETYGRRRGRTYLIIVPKKGEEIPIMLTWTRHSVKRIAEVLNIDVADFRAQRVAVTVAVVVLLLILLLSSVFF